MRTRPDERLQTRHQSRRPLLLARTRRTLRRRDSTGTRCCSRPVTAGSARPALTPRRAPGPQPAETRNARRAGARQLGPPTPWPVALVATRRCRIATGLESCFAGVTGIFDRRCNLRGLASGSSSLVVGENEAGLCVSYCEAGLASAGWVSSSLRRRSRRGRWRRRSRSRGSASVGGHHGRRGPCVGGSRQRPPRLAG
jgi:hypothetical protein